MGGDGGVIATQRAFLRGAKKAGSEGNGDQKMARNDEQLLKATTCCLTGEALREPIVCCELGNLYNKDAVIEALLEKRLEIDAFSHIRGLKDFKTLKFTRSTNSEAADEMLKPVFVCPVTNVECNGLQSFHVIWSTGWVISDKAVRELGIEALQSEYGPFTAVDLVRLVPTEQEIDSARAQMHHRRSLQPIKKSKKRSAESHVEEEEKAVEKPKKVKDDLGKKRVMESVTQSIKSQTQSSDVYKNLFHKDGEKDKKDRDLFMSVAGIRYTL